MYKSKNMQNVSTESYNFKTLPKTEVNDGTTEMSLKFNPNLEVRDGNMFEEVRSLMSEYILWGQDIFLIFWKHSCFNSSSRQKTRKADKARHRLEWEVRLFSCLFSSCFKESFDGTGIKSAGEVLLRLYMPFVLSLTVFLGTQRERNL